MGLEPESIYREMEKILRSRTFRRAAGQRKFLRYTVTEALEGRGHLLKESPIGAFSKGRVRPARTSAFQFKGQHLDVREIGRRFDVNAVVEGGVRTSRNRRRIVAQFNLS